MGVVLAQQRMTFGEAEEAEDLLGGGCNQNRKFPYVVRPFSMQME
jgi:hypothetical protein